jgi:sugar phosphate isomerase/epimerase
MNSMNRREALMAIAGAGSAALLSPAEVHSSETIAPRTSMGIVTYALGIHQKNHWAGRHQGLSPALALLEESRLLGAAGIQVDLGPQDASNITELRARIERYQMYIEASLTMPRAETDLDRFEASVRLAKDAGAALARTVIMPGRRYEQFKSLAEFRLYEQRGLQSLQWAEPILARHRLRLAVENHKDQRIAEKLETIKRLSSECIGICVDVGNNFTLLEEPLETAQAFASYAFTVHFKDQAVRENQTGFWFADVPLGQGFLDLPAMIKVLRQANPAIHFNLEVITRDPLNVPILTDEFWVTFPDLPARELARTVRMIKARSSPKPFVNVSRLSSRRQLDFEHNNVQQSLAYARQQLDLV